MLRCFNASISGYNRSMRFRIIFFLSFFAPLFAFASAISNAGFIPSPLWFSRDTFFAGETVRVYTIVYNGSEADIRGTVEFLNKDALIGAQEFSLARGGRSQDIWIDWKAIEGDYRISARITGARMTVVGGAEESVDLSQMLTTAVDVAVDTDTDKDGAGNKADDDDDNDGVSDKDEIRSGTNPLVKDISPKSAVDDTVSYVTLSSADKAADIVTEKAVNTGSVLSSFTESIREKGSRILDGKTEEARKEIADIRSREDMARIGTTAKGSEEFNITATTSRAKEIAEQKVSQGFFERASTFISSIFSKIANIIPWMSARSNTEEETQAVQNESFSVHTPFSYVKFFTFATLAFIFRHAIFFYLFVAFLVYIFIRVVIMATRRR